MLNLLLLSMSYDYFSIYRFLNKADKVNIESMFVNICLRARPCFEKVRLYFTPTSSIYIYIFDFYPFYEERFICNYYE